MMNYLTKPILGEPKEEYLDHRHLGIEESKFLLHKDTSTLLGFPTAPKAVTVEYEQETETEETSSQNNDELEFRIRDFAYSESDVRHWGEYIEEEEVIGVVLVRALYDFTAEDPSELSFTKGDFLYIQYKQCEGWLVGYLGDSMGLIPECYVELVAC